MAEKKKLWWIHHNCGGLAHGLTLTTSPADQPPSSHPKSRVCQINLSIEFAILSDEDSFDSIIDYISKHNRKCRRVKTGAPKKKVRRKTIISRSPQRSVYEGEHANKDEQQEWVYLEQQDSLVAYRETKDRLKLVATRPYNLSSLRDYIHINNQELVERGKLSVEEIIDMMELNNEIEVKGSLVAYHF